MKVLQVSRWLCASGGGGIQTYLRCIAESLRDRDVELSYAALLPGTVPDYAEHGAYIGEPGRPKILNALSLWRWFARESAQVDLVHIHGVTDWHFIVGASVCLVRRKPFVVSLHGALLAGALAQIRRFPRITVPMLKLGARLLMERAYCVVTTTEYEGEAIRKLGKRINLELVRPGVYVSDKRPLRSSLEIVHTLRVLFVGSVEPVKALPTLLRAIKRVVEGGISVQLDIVGNANPHYENDLQQLIVTLELGDRVTWHGYRTGDAKRALMERAHVLVLPSLSENFGFVVAEAMAVGTPVVVSDGVGLAPLVLESKSGAVFEVENAPELAARLAEFLDSNYRLRCGENAFLRASSELSLDTMGESLMAVYSAAISTAGRSYERQSGG